MRTLRVKKVLGRKDVKVADLFPVVCLHGVFNFILPFRTGELSLVVLMKKIMNIDLSQGTGTLIAARIFDFITVALFIPIVLLFSKDMLPDYILVSIYLYFVFVAAVSVLFLFLKHNNSSGSDASGTGENSLRKKITGFMISTANSIAKIKKTGTIAEVLIYSVLIWICLYLDFYFIVRGLGYSVSLYNIVLILLLMVPVSLFPIQGFVNIGTHQLVWVVAFKIFGYDAETGLAAAMSSHAILIVFVFALGLFAALNFYIKIFKRRSDNDR